MKQRSEHRLERSKLRKGRVGLIVSFPSKESSKLLKIILSTDGSNASCHSVNRETALSLIVTVLL